MLLSMARELAAKHSPEVAFQIAITIQSKLNYIKTSERQLAARKDAEQELKWQEDGARFCSSDDYDYERGKITELKDKVSSLSGWGSECALLEREYQTNKKELKRLSEDAHAQFETMIQMHGHQKQEAQIRKNKAVKAFAQGVCELLSAARQSDGLSIYAIEKAAKEAGVHEVKRGLTTKDSRFYFAANPELAVNLMQALKAVEAKVIPTNPTPLDNNARRIEPLFLQLQELVCEIQAAE
ncbi:hypothetical protein [Vibrio crassostreae]|uniref:hypothetical protein n=1 Tax=Vibrio crassostreae TaxID=246167 RepID=UPI001B306953|nr:hypothetical protein [Vibrio crassostreae]